MCRKKKNYFPTNPIFRRTSISTSLFFNNPICLFIIAVTSRLTASDAIVDLSWKVTWWCLYQFNKIDNRKSILTKWQLSNTMKTSKNSKTFSFPRFEKEVSQILVSKEKISHLHNDNRISILLSPCFIPKYFRMFSNIAFFLLCPCLWESIHVWKW